MVAASVDDIAHNDTMVDNNPQPDAAAAANYIDLVAVVTETVDYQQLRHNALSQVPPSPLAVVLASRLAVV